MPVIVPFSDDSISHALYYESLKTALSGRGVSLQCERRGG